MQRRYNHSGMGNGTYNDLEPYSTFNINGMGNVTLNNIGKGATISTSGIGNLIVNGTVGEDVTFKISGMGSVKFSTRPPQSVLNRIEKSGMGDIKMPGGYSSPQSDNDNNDNYFSSGNVVIGNMSIGGIRGNRISGIQNGNFGGVSITSRDGLVKATRNGVTTTYAGNNASLVNNELYIDNNRVTESDPRIVHIENAAPNRSSNVVINNFGSTHSFLQSVLPGNREENTNRTNTEKKSVTELSSINDYSPSTKAYINSFKDKEKNIDALNGLQLSEDEEKLLENYCDPITADVINIPVILNERLYDLDTLIKIQQRDKLDPYTKYEFTLRDIQPSRKSAEELQKIVLQIKGLRKNQKTVSQVETTAANTTGRPLLSGIINEPVSINRKHTGLTLSGNADEIIAALNQIPKKY